MADPVQLDVFRPRRSPSEEPMAEPRVPDDDISRWHAAIAPELRAAFEDVLAGPRFTMGPNLTAFETEFAAYCGAHASIGISSGTAALHLALLALGVGPGDEVITVPNTYIATAFAITYTGALPVFVDVDPVTLNMDPALILPALTERTKAILPVHMYGQCADVEAIRRAAPGIAVLEDAAHAHGATLGDRSAGSLGELAAFSFYPTKVLGALGDGGAITASTPELEAQVRQLRYMGQKVKFDHAILGYQERLDEMQAAFLRVKLRYLDEQVAGRRRVAARYAELLGRTPLTLPPDDVTGRHAYYMYTVLAPERDDLVAHLNKREIDNMVIYPRLVTQAGAYASLPWRSEPIPVAESLPDRLLSLPMFAELTDEEIDRVGAAITEFYGTA
ncbi:MAG TPA: DegT/DnrJ/EryC1/StrS family aminotransferase [Streptosporangiaceae bacterium]|nr:DegT/DnrJ/EryC1/StrS family aminotransferase [Streptosporangiaceae bacterium]